MLTSNTNDSEGEGSGPLSGLRVLELSAYVQGPVAGLILASLGADVVKIEYPGSPDVMRGVQSLHGVDLDDRGRNWLYSSLNRGKRSIAIDITTTSGQAVFVSLLARSDVFVTNLRPDALSRMSADYESVKGNNSQIVYAQGGGFGFEGVMANDACQDTSGMAFSGFMDTLSSTDVPSYPPGALGDILTGSNLAAAALGGLVRRSLHGRGGLARTSQLQSLLWLQMLPVGMAGSLQKRMPRSPVDETNPLYTIHRTSDGWIAVAAINQRHWVTLATTLGLAHLLEDPRYGDIVTAEANTSDLRAELAPVLGSRTTSEWWAALRDSGVWCAPVNQVQDLPHHPQVLANDYVREFPDGFLGVPLPFFLSDWHGALSTAADYGAHTDEVLTELLLTEDRIVDLRRAESCGVTRRWRLSH